MKVKITKMNDFFDGRLAACSERSQQLTADGRDDEATFEKIKGNIYEIFRTVFSVALENCGENDEQVRAFFDQRIAQIPSSWAAALEKARVHQDMERVYLEQIKLDTAHDIQENFYANFKNKLNTL